MYILPFLYILIIEISGFQDYEYEDGCLLKCCVGGLVEAYPTQL
jgi:hypothetical protein